MFGPVSCPHPVGRGGMRTALAIVAIIGLSALVPPFAHSVSADALAATIKSAQITDPYGSVYEQVYYGPKPAQRADIFASSVPNSTIVILVHGGGWRKQLALSHFASEAMALQQQGFTVFDINYDQDSATTPAFPLEPNDVMAATRWAIANAGLYNANPKNVVLLGGSAGGNLVALAAERLDSTNPGTVRAVISFSGPMNFTTLVPLVENGTITSESFVISISQALGLTYETDAFLDVYEQEWSPALNIPSSNCPAWLLFNSETELIPLSQAQEMYTNLQAAKCNATLQVLPGTAHAFAYWDNVASAVFSFIKSE
jgi:acetyl esterase/lipase